jgi:hypothetical protein
MNEPHYEFHETDDKRYIYHFLSIGKQNTRKQVVFYPAKDIENTYILAFGDLLSDDSIDCNIVSNNGDIRFIMATVYEITLRFFVRKPDVNLLFWGSDQRRNSLYSYIIAKNIEKLELSYDIYGIKINGEGERFSPHVAYSSFVVRKKI